MRDTGLLIAAVAALASCSPAEEAPEIEPIAYERADAALAAHGQRVADVLGCTGCHRADLTGEDWSEEGFMRLWTSNLTRALPAYSDAQLAATIRSGKRPDGSELWGMPSFTFTDLSEDDMAAVIAFMRTKPASGDVHPRPEFEAPALKEIEAGTLKSAPTEVRETTAGPPDMGPEFALGRYIARTTCAECHGMDLRGGTPYPGATPRPDLRMVTAYDLPAFETLMRTGTPIGGRDIGLMGEVARGRYAHFTAAEVQALHAYLQRVGATPD